MTHKTFDHHKATSATTRRRWPTRTTDTLHGLFEKQCARRRSGVAAVCAGESITYGELNHRAEQVAQVLLDAGLEREELVGLFFDRSIEMLVAVLGVLKAGGAYVPIDPAYPADRVAFVLDDAGARLLLTQRELTASLPHAPAQVFCVEEITAKAAAIATNERWPEVAANDLAYVIYTSGSTGKPKGVMIEHAAAVNTIEDINQRFDVGARDRILALSSYSFDLSVYDMFGLWAVGGCVVLPVPQQTRRAEDWARLCHEHGVTIWDSVPASMEMMIRHLEDRPSDALKSLRVVLLSGDWIGLSLPDRIRRGVPQARVISLGGATEVSIWSILYPIDQIDPKWKSIPYGRAMTNQSVHILSDALEELPVGTAGQIYYGGAGVARGYYRRAELTRERFVQRTCEDGSTMRLYASGDVGRWRADGTVELLGRLDNQVKIRGYRVELGEVESELARHPAVRQAVVIADKAASGQNQLISFVVANHGCEVTAAELRRMLQAALPEYMVPAQIVILDAFPLTDNQKVDRRALAELVARRQSPSTVTGPANDLERRVLGIWHGLFARDDIGVEDDFFAVGGDSLMAARLFAALERQCQWTATLDVLLEHSTVRALAQAIAAGPLLLEGASSCRPQTCDPTQSPATESPAEKQTQPSLVKETMLRWKWWTKGSL